MREINVKNKKLPVIGIGTWRTGDNPKIKDQEIEAIRYGLTHGANLIDTAEMYGSGRSERLIGQALDQLDRKNIFIISKFYPQNATPSLMRRSLENSLKRLGTDYLDLYLLHWRGNVPLKDTVSGLRQLKSEGLIKEWGVSNFDLDDMKELFAIEGGNEVFANEDYYNLGGRGIDFDLLPWQRNNRFL
ncbi:hypothetical protein Q757_02060 [Oenococcus alcoholitolerans]|uniref:NADP-dependent oxidoreductase domain-containing protein n=1 Tax=Oenococcus alcoholitolerans TaxID=931074 RepID=A0ABR4XS60_9LACO|nr:hypothetical protein Q757_02060 [Oenococcus alcoholitolerans]